VNLAVGESNATIGDARPSNREPMQLWLLVYDDTYSSLVDQVIGRPERCPRGTPITDGPQVAAHPDEPSSEIGGLSASGPEASPHALVIPGRLPQRVTSSRKPVQATSSSPKERRAPAASPVQVALDGAARDRTSEHTLDTRLNVANAELRLCDRENLDDGFADRAALPATIRRDTTRSGSRSPRLRGRWCCEMLEQAF
jgi:hypothetical protein